MDPRSFMPIYINVQLFSININIQTFKTFKSIKNIQSALQIEVENSQSI